MTADQLLAAPPPPNRLSASPQFFPNSVTCGDVLALRFHEEGEQLTGFTSVKAVAFQVGDTLVLPGDLVFAARNMLFDLPQALFDHRPGSLPQTLL